MSNLERFMMIPFKVGGRDENGCDCWGLFRLVFEHLTGIVLPIYGGVQPGSAFVEAAAIRAAVSSDDWIKIDKPRPLAGVHMDAHHKIDGRWKRIDNHVGLILEDGKRLLQTAPGIGVTNIPLNHPVIKTRVKGFYIHKVLHSV